MPTYNFRNTKTDEVSEVFMPMSKREEYLKENPDLEQILTPIAIADPVGMGITRPPADFSKYVLGRVKETNPLGTALERRWHIQREH